MKIYAPVPDFNGLRANVMFVNGVGETNDPYMIRWFEMHGYKVDKTTASYADTWEAGGGEAVEETEPDFESMTPNDLRDWAKANGLGNQIKNIRNKEKLLEIIRG